jgi:glycyl-tRNA synthetase alpha chain
MTYQEMILALHKFWQDKGCIISTSYDSEIGAGTFNPLTFFGVLGKEPWRIAFVQISKRPKDGRYAENPVRLQQFFQYQVVLKPPPFDVQDIYLNSIEGLGINLGKHDVRFVEDDWKSETLGASGLGWEVWLDGMEITQFTYFQVIGGKELNPISCELTYGLGRIAMLIQEKDSLFDIEWGKGVKYGNIYRERISIFRI